MNEEKVKRGRPDYILLGTVLFLVFLGILIQVSVSAAPSMQDYGSVMWLLLRHVLFGLLPGGILAYFIYRMSLETIKKWAPLLLLFNLFLMVLVFVPHIGINAGGASRWINLKVTSFQPSEFLKLTFVLYLAAWLSVYVREAGAKARKSLGNATHTLWLFLAIVGVIAFILILQPDISTLGVILISALIMYFVSETPMKHIAFMVTVGIAGLLLLIKIAPYRLGRLTVFLNPNSDPMGLGYQIKQALIAVGSGGLIGKGLGMGLQGYGFLPQSMSDSVFAMFTEETGFIGGFILVALFILFAWRGFYIAKHSKDGFSKLACIGISSWITIQAFVNMGAMMGILPLTGIPLPFISYGGSALVAELAAIGVMLNISTKMT